MRWAKLVLRKAYCVYGGSIVCEFEIPVVCKRVFQKEGKKADLAAMFWRVNQALES